MPASIFLIGLGAGAASALLYVAAASGSPLALLLLYVAPLPTLLAAIGWRHYAGLVAALFGASVLTFVLGPKTGVFFIVSVGLPAWWLAYLALLARTGDDGRTEWYPVGRLVLWCAVIGAGLVALSIPLIATSLEEYRATLKAMFERALQAPGGGPAPELPGGQDPAKIIDLMATLAPGLAAAVWTISSIFTLWLAGRITRASGKLARPWPDIPMMEYPRRAPLGLIGAFAGSLLPGLAGLVAELFAGTLLIAFTMLGLAVMHVTTRAMPMRGLVLFALYAVLLLQPWVAIFLAGLGLGELTFGIRRRFGPPPPPAPPAAANLP